MNQIEEAYNIWSEIYDTNQNKTRDLEGETLCKILANQRFINGLEIGCGTGKNTAFLLSICEELTAVDLSENMLAIARQKIDSEGVTFLKADINQDWDFLKLNVDLITFSLVLEHIENLKEVLQKASEKLVFGGIIYVCELHPFKQYVGSQARFETDAGTQFVTAFMHHITDFTNAAKASNLELIEINESFDNDNRTEIPRLLNLVFRKN